jgi:hypothetical protein
MYTLIRLVRGFFGFVAAWQVLGLLPVLSWLQDIDAVNGNMMAILVVKILAMAMSFGAFFVLRTLINNLHMKRHGTQHPALIKKWAL